jgi:predicted RNase H-like nuclease (RuvC/YqgF family)
VSWYDDEEEPNEEHANFVTSLTGRCDSDKDLYGDDITYDELFDSYEDTCHEVLKQKNTILWLERENKRLLSTISELKNQATSLTYQLENLDIPTKRTNNNAESDIHLVKKEVEIFTKT